MKLKDIKYKFYIESKTLEYRLLNKFKPNYGLNPSPATPPLIISLTTHGKRIHQAYIAIESLMQQQVKADKIILWVGKKECSNMQIPHSLKLLQERGLNLEFVDQDIGPATKLIYCLQKHPDSTIITCDDDIIYPKYFIRDIVSAANRFPHSIIGYRCAWIEIHNQLVLPYLQWRPSKQQAPSILNFPTGTSGVLYPPKSLHAEILNVNNLLKLAPTADDIWFKAMAILNNTKTAMTYPYYIEFPTVRNTQDYALFRTNNRIFENSDNKLCPNDVQLKNVFNHYDLYNKLAD